MAKPSKKSDMDPNFERQVNARVNDAKKEAEALQNNTQNKWDFPALWEGNIFDRDSVTDAFSRDKANEDYEKAVSNPDSPGTSGDLVATTTQIDYMATMERAFVARHGFSAMQFGRAVAHASGRKEGHGNNAGVFKRSVLDYVRQVLKQAGAS